MVRAFVENARLDALHQLRLLDTPLSESFDRITRMASQIFGLPVAAVSLTDRDRQWFKSRVGIDHDSIPRLKAPCAEVAETASMLVIEDMAESPGYADSPLAQAGTRFYAGAPLVTNDGYGLGSLCVLGTEPRTATPDELAALRDLAAMVMAQIELQHAFGRIDPTSGLPTRSQLLDDLSDLGRDRAGERRFLVVADFASDEQMARVMRALGSARVDDLVREAAGALRAFLPPDRILYHLGTAQFALLSPAGIEQAAYLQRLQADARSLRNLSSARFVTSAAVGVRPFVAGESTADDVLRGAMAAAQDARDSGGLIALYSAARDTAHRRQYRLLRDFGAALEADDQLRLVFQPRVDLRTGRCVGAEALLRWQHPKLGEVSPAEFIPIVEQTTLARATTQWVLDTALDQLARWSLAGPAIPLSVNISAANLTESDLVRRIRHGLESRGLHAQQLELELTESAIMDHPDRALCVLRELASTGICLAIDDFGTGHSSLAYLQRLPVQVVKIDQAFVRNLSEAAGSDFLLLEAMVDLACKLGFRIVAEGVETREAAAVLAGMACEEAQGYLFARPMEAAELAAWVSDGSAPAAAEAMVA